MGLRNTDGELVIENALYDAKKACESDLDVARDEKAEKKIEQMTHVDRAIRCYEDEELGLKLRLFVSKRQGVTLRVTDNQFESVTFFAKDRDAEKLVVSLVPFMLVNDANGEAAPEIVADMLADEFDELAIANIRRGGSVGVRMNKN